MVKTNQSAHCEVITAYKFQYIFRYTVCPNTPSIYRYFGTQRHPGHRIDYIFLPGLGRIRNIFLPAAGLGILTTYFNGIPHQELVNSHFNKIGTFYWDPVFSFIVLRDCTPFGSLSFVEVHTFNIPHRQNQFYTGIPLVLLH